MKTSGRPFERNHMKKLYLIVIALLILTCLASCGSKVKKGDYTDVSYADLYNTPDTYEGKDIHITVRINYAYSDEYGMASALDSEANEYIIYQLPENSEKLVTGAVVDFWGQYLGVCDRIGEFESVPPVPAVLVKGYTVAK